MSLLYIQKAATVEGEQPQVISIMERHEDHAVIQQADGSTARISLFTLENDYREVVA